MKRTPWILCLCLSLSLSYCAAASATEKILLTTQHWPPYQSYVDDVFDGTAVQVVQCALEKMEQPFEMKIFPWKRAQKMVEDGDAQGFFSASQNQTRDEYAVFSESIAGQNWTWYLRQDSPFHPEDDSFKTEAEVTGQFGTNMLHWLETNGYTVKGHVNTPESLLRLILRGTHDAVLMNELVAQEALRQLDESPDKFTIVLNRSKPLGVYWSKTFLAEHLQFLETFNQFVKECRQ